MPESSFGVRENDLRGPLVSQGFFSFLSTRTRSAAQASRRAKGTIGATMPKMKTHKASKKRFRVTATGKMKRSQAGKKHLNSHKTGKRKRHLREGVVSGNKFACKYIKAMGGDA